MSINLYKKKTINNQPVLEELLSKSTDTVDNKPLVYDSATDNVKSTDDLTVNSVTASCFHGPLDGTAKNATCFDNKTYAEACADILLGTAANATCFAGKTCTEWKDIIKTTCVDNAALATNATCFNGCTYSEACTDIRNGLATQACADAIQNCADYIQSCVSAIESKIPAQASASNQLADKDFVNSSITTNTANFRGTYARVDELPSTGNTNNDYAFVCSLNTTTGNYIYDRYKWVASDSCWVCEYELNTTGFTAEQLASINSGITSNLVAKITDVYDNTVTVCMNGECKGSFSLNQNTDVCIDLGDSIRNACNANYATTAAQASEATNATKFDNKTYNEAYSDIRTGTVRSVKIGTSNAITPDGTGLVCLPAYPTTMDNAICFNGCTYEQAKADFRDYTPDLATCAINIARCTANSGSCYLALFDGNTAVSNASLYVSNAKQISFCPATGCLSTCYVRGISGIIAGNPIGCTSSVLGQSGTNVSSGTLNLYTASPSIGFHVNDSAAISQSITATCGNLRVCVNNRTGCDDFTEFANFDFKSDGTFTGAYTICASTNVYSAGCPVVTTGTLPTVAPGYNCTGTSNYVVTTMVCCAKGVCRNQATTGTCHLALFADKTAIANADAYVSNACELTYAPATGDMKNSGHLCAGYMYSISPSYSWDTYKYIKISRLKNPSVILARSYNSTYQIAIDEVPSVTANGDYGIKGFASDTGNSIWLKTIGYVSIEFFSSAPLSFEEQDTAPSGVTFIEPTRIGAKVETTATTSNANYFLTFVDSNNETAASEDVYTDAGLYYNPSNHTLITTCVSGTCKVVTPKVEAGGNLTLSTDVNNTQYCMCLCGSNGVLYNPQGYNVPSSHAVGSGDDAMIYGGILNDNLSSVNCLCSYRSIVGTSSIANAWYNVISIRHVNGSGDGTCYGVALYQQARTLDHWCYKQQVNGTWQGENQLIDSTGGQTINGTLNATGTISSCTRFLVHPDQMVPENTNYPGVLAGTATYGWGYNGGAYIGHLNANHDEWWGFATFGFYNFEDNTICSAICVDRFGTLFANTICGNLCGNATYFGGCTYAQAKADILSGIATTSEFTCINDVNLGAQNILMTSSTGTLGVVNASTGTNACPLTFNPATGVLCAKCFCGNVTASGQIDCSVAIKRYQATTGNCHIALFNGNTAIDNACAYVSSGCTLTFNPSTGELGLTSLKVCNMTVASSSATPISLTCGSYKVEIGDHDDISIGFAACANGLCSIAIGCGANAPQPRTIAIGCGAYTKYGPYLGVLIDCNVVYSTGASAHFRFGGSVPQSEIYCTLACLGKEHSPMWPIGCGCTYCGRHMVPAKWILRSGDCSNAGSWISWDGDGNIDLTGTVVGSDHAISGTSTTSLGARIEIWADWPFTYWQIV